MTSIFVAKLDFNVTNEQLKEVFSTYGNVLKATVATDRETGKSRGFAFVEMAIDEEAQEAIKSLDGYAFNGRRMAVKEAEKRERGSNTSAPRPASPNTFQSNPKAPQREDQRTPPSAGNSAWVNTESPAEARKIEPKRKKEEKKRTWENDATGGKKTKMNAYKKSNKQGKFFDEDEDDWDDYMAFKRKEDVDDDDED
jgi:RNA recognition motif-containing protein